jgi:SAM-dependent methyltransferase
VAHGLVRLGRRVVGIDRSADMLSEAAARFAPGGGAAFAVGDATRLPLRAASVDDAYSVWLLHLTDARGVLEEVARVLRPGGRYLVVPVTRSGPDDPMVRRLTDQMALKLRGGDPLDAPERLVELARDLPFRSRGLVEGEPEVVTTTAAQAIRHLELRLWFVLDGVTDEVWDAVVAPTLVALRALPDPEEIVSYQAVPRVLVLDRV